MMEVGLHHYLALSAILFGVGAWGVVIRRNAIVILMCVEVMLNAANLAFIAFARFHGQMDGHVFVFMVMAVAAAEAAVGLAIVIAIFRNRASVDVDDLNLLKW